MLFSNKQALTNKERCSVVEQWPRLLPQHESQKRMTQISLRHPCYHCYPWDPWIRVLWCYAEDTPQSVVELEGRLRAIEVIARNPASASCAIHRNNVHVI